jgi:hypothetical protein
VAPVRKQGRCGVKVRASRCLQTPRAACGSHGSVDIAPSVDSSFSSSPPSSPPPVRGGADGDETSMRLGLGAQGGAVVAYL